ncbi:G-protein coupled receptor protein [Thelonectria olida]|uniref:G-protein coupled receptor protein n=1 Tax=Thelonectria olida TaxID=1576542 RepID=A0A9P8VXZ1_9HYPO|nr:G-protein coupled receptor protein [Thelonectria olida]
MEQPHQQTHEKGPHDHVLESPLWVTIIRGFQILLSIIILGLCAALMHDAYLDEEGFSLAVSLLTWLGVGYIVLTEKIVGFRGAYHIIAVVVVDSLLVVLWLAAFASMAAKRAAYVVPVTVNGCVDDGSLVDSKTCYRRRAIEQMMKRDVILFKSGLAMTAAIAGLGALMWLLFCACLVWEIIGFVQGRKQGRFAMSSSPTTTTPNNNYQMESKIAESQPMSPQSYPSQTQNQPFQDVSQGQFQQQQQVPPQNQQAPYQQTQSPYQQGQAVYPPPTQSPSPFPPQQQQQNFNQYPPQQQQQQYQQPIQPQMTGQSHTVSTTYSSELDGHQYPPSAVSPPPQHYQQPYPPQQ